jgi:L-asparaginase II
LVELLRNGLDESVHRGAIVISGPDGKVLQSLGHPAMPTFLRSTAKPLQALPVITSGAADAFNLNSAELAIMCGSLNGEDFQVDTLKNILERAGLDSGLLLCGIHRPSHAPTARELAQRGEEPTVLHNNCAGKHIAMLLLCKHLGFPLEGYDQPGHPVQKLILATVADLCRYPAEQIGLGVDGCGVPVFRVPLFALAGSYARLAAPRQAGLPEETAAAVERLMAACLEHPGMIAGTDRLCTRLMQAAPGKLLAKTGAEGSYALALPEKGLGVGLQIEDGNPRALAPAVCMILHEMDILDHEALEGPLADLASPKLSNHRGDQVAELRAVFAL